MTLTGLTNDLGEMLLIAPRIFISISSIYLATIVLYCKRWMAEAIRLAHKRIMIRREAKVIGCRREKIAIDFRQVLYVNCRYLRAHENPYQRR